MSGKNKYKWSLAAFVIGTCSLTAKDYIVGNQNELDTALSQLVAGDRVLLEAGEWKDAEIRFSGKGNEGEPIVLGAMIPGKAIITGRSSLKMAGSHLVVRDLVFRHVQPPEGEETIVDLRLEAGDSAYDSQLTGLLFEECNPAESDTRYAWVRMYGKRNSVDHCRFAGQNHNGVTVQVRLEEANADHRIEWNHFLDRKPGNGNGFECIQVAQSGDSMKEGDCIIRKNLFQSCDGETEIVSNKSCKNKYIGNVFLNSAGTLTLRHGNDCLVEGNIFIGKGKPGSGGVRVIGERHTIRNNYFESLTGRTGATVVFYCGIPDSPLNGYFAAHDARLENNLFIANIGNAICLNSGQGRRDRSILPKGIEITGNFVDLEDDRGNVVLAGLTDYADISDNFSSKRSEGAGLINHGFAVVDLQLQENKAGLKEVAKLEEFHFQMPHLLKAVEVGPAWQSLSY